MPSLSSISGRRAALIVALAAATALGACNKSKTPEGQIVAVVDGDDVTRRDVQAELVAAKVPASVDMKAIQPLVVDQIVNRKLLVAEADKEKLDKSPEYLAAEQRAREVVLAEMLVQRWASRLTPPSADQVRTFITDNPQMFGDRKIIAVDQLRTAKAGLDPAALKPLNSNDQIAAYLTAQKHPFQRGQSTIDTLTVAKDAIAKIDALAPGMPFVVSEGGAVLIDAVLDRKAAPVPEAQWQALAGQALAKQSGDTLLRDQLKSLRSTAKIAYQPGFAPAKPSATPPPGSSRRPDPSV